MYNSKAEEVKNKVSIPMYFYNIVIPQMTDYYSDYTVDFDSKPTAKCCLHDEDTPSLRYYEETNTFSCFGCKKGGDVIRLHTLFMEKINGSKPTFNESVNFLYEYFIKGNENTQAVSIGKSTQKDYKNTTVDIMMLSKYCSELDKQLMSDKTISDEAKSKIWKAMDELNILVSLNMVDAIESKQYIRQVVRENIK